MESLLRGRETYCEGKAGGAMRQLLGKENQGLPLAPHRSYADLSRR